MSDEKQPVQYYDLKAARAHGISDEDILNQLAQTHNYDLAGAREHGVSDSDILSTLVATKPPAEPVTEKESPEIMGGIGATAGVLGAAGDVIYSKGRPLIRMAEKAMGKEPSTPLPKQRAFLDPSAVAEQAIARRTAPSVDVTGSPSAVRNWGVSQHEGEFLGGKEYSEADKIKKEALAFEKANPGHKVMPGSLLAVPEHEARNVAQKRAELAAQEDALKQAEVQAVAQKRAERLGERSALKQQQTKYDVAKGTAGLFGKAVLPIMGGYQLGSQGAQAYNRLTRPDLTARDVLSGAANVVGAGTGALSMVPSKYRIPAAITSQAAGTLANMLDKRNPRDEIVEEKAAGGSIQGYADGGEPQKINANETGAFVGYPQINKNRKIGSGTGFLDALVGAPPSRTNILNPSDYSYMEGYEKGEPYGIASMALPFAGAAAKPLAKEVATRAFMGESLAPKMMRGLMPEQPVSNIIAYHGTPHNFNKFDLSEIGQGEGSQAFGHGIYLAENPGVAKGYQQALSGQMVTDKDLMEYFKPGEIRKKMGGYDKVISFHPATENKNWHTVVQEVVKNKEGDWIPHLNYGRPRAHSTTPDPIDFKQNMGRELGPAGYLYKVDVPDEHIAKMVDWDLPFKEQPQHIQEAFAKVNPIAVMQKDPSNEFTRWLRLPDTAKVLQKMDVPGIKYLDRGSRFGNQNAKTQNYVVFDPDKSTKILEKNNEPVGPLSNLEPQQ